VRADNWRHSHAASRSSAQDEELNATLTHGVIGHLHGGGAHEDASWRFSVFSRRKLLRQIPRSDQTEIGQTNFDGSRGKSMEQTKIRET
jgi:hypothetical protein